MPSRNGYALYSKQLMQKEGPIEGSPERPGLASLLPLGQPSSAAEAGLVSKVGAAPAAGSEAVSCRAPASLVLYHRGKQLPTRRRVRSPIGI